MTTRTIIRSEMLLEAALAYGRRGFRVFPLFEINAQGFCSCSRGPKCEHPGKHPRTINGVNDSTSDEAIIRQFWQRHPEANIGIATGPGFGVVIDIDPRNGGDKSLIEFQQKFGPLPPTATVLTGGGGEHRIFCYIEGIRNKANLLPGIDVKSDRGYIVAAPSNHFSGGEYQWVEGAAPGDLPLAEIPNVLLRLLTAKTDGGRGAREGKDNFNEGNRNSALFAIAAKLAKAGISKPSLLAALLEENSSRCVPPLSASEVESIVENALRYSTENSSWGIPTELPSKEKEVPSLKPEMLPGALLPWVSDFSDRMQIPPEFFAIPLLTSISSSIGRLAEISPKRFDDWTETPNLWGMLVAMPGTRKSPCLTEAIRTLRALEGDAIKVYREKLIQFQADEEVAKSRIENIKKSLKEGTDPVAATLASKSIEEIKLSLEKRRPKFTRYIVNDSTIEKLQELLHDNPYGLLSFRDEVYGLFKALEKKGHETDRSFLLEAWSGKGNHTSDRIIRGTTHLKNFCLTILGGIQPERLQHYFESVLTGDSGDDGLLARFQLLVWPAEMKNYVHIDRPPEAGAKAKVENLFKQFIAAREESDHTDKPLKFKFTDEAQERFNKWITSLELRLRSGSIKSGALQAHMSKYRSLMPSLALIFHLIEVVDKGEVRLNSCPPVPLGSVELAISWCIFLEEHASKIYAATIAPHIFAAHAIAAKIRANEITDGTTFRKIHRNGWTGLGSPELVRQGLDLLMELNWLKICEVRSPNGGAPSEVIVLNPALRAGGDR